MQDRDNVQAYALKEAHVGVVPRLLQRGTAVNKPGKESLAKTKSHFSSSLL